MWDCQRGKKKITFPRQVLTHSLVCSQNKGLREYQRRHSWLHTCPSPPPEAERQACNSQTQKVRAPPILTPGTGTLYQTVSRLPVASHFFLGSWTVDICQKGCSLRSAPQRRHRAHLRQCFHGTPSKPSSWDRGGDYDSRKGSHSVISNSLQPHGL